jgi:hypothetical protein
MMNLDELDYPIPDPTWDYATIYQCCQWARQELEKPLAYMSGFEKATGESDRGRKDSDFLSHLRRRRSHP